MRWGQSRPSASSGGPAGRRRVRRPRFAGPCAYSQRSSVGASRTRITCAGTPATTAFSGTSSRHHRARADDRVVADGHPAQHARSVADPHVVPDAYVALVDALQPDRPLDLDGAVVEVDQHHPVGEDALAPDLYALVGGDRALLTHHGLGADRHLALVHPDLAAVPDPRPAADSQPRVRSDLELHARTHEADPVRLQTPAEAQLQPSPPHQQPRVVVVDHVVRTHPSPGAQAVPRPCHERAS